MRIRDILEGGASRIVEHIRTGTPFITITAYREDAPPEMNKNAQAALKQKLRALPVSMIEIGGEYKGRSEHSLFVMSKKFAGNRIALDKFRDFGLRLARAFNQESIGYGDGKQIHLLFTNGGSELMGDAVTFSERNVNALPGFSMIKSSRFSFTDTDKHKSAVAYGKDRSYTPTSTRKPNLP